MNFDTNNMPTSVGILILKQIIDTIRRSDRQVTIEEVAERLESKTSVIQRKRIKLDTISQIQLGMSIVFIYYDMEKMQ
jgi:hypothetical protein